MAKINIDLNAPEPTPKREKKLIIEAIIMGCLSVGNLILNFLGSLGYLANANIVIGFFAAIGIWSSTICAIACVELFQTAEAEYKKNCLETSKRNSFRAEILSALSECGVEVKN